MAQETLEIPDILKDPLYIRCLSLAALSKGQKERYGSLLVRDGEVLGQGYNRAIAHQSFGRLERIIRMGYANHAEVEAMNDALQSLDVERLDGCDIYVAGYFPKPTEDFEQPGRLFLKEEPSYSCVLCANHFENYNIRNVYVPMQQGWTALSVAEAKSKAKGFSSCTHQKRRETLHSIFTISDVELITPDILAIE